MNNEKVVETKICKLCNSSFEITDKDLEFYEKISPIFDGKKYLIPTPTLCPDCRQQRKLSFRNERKLYKRKCDLSGKSIVSLYSPDKSVKVYEQKEWWSDKWDAMDYGSDFDFEKSFFEQFEVLQKKVPKQSLVDVSSEKSEYCNITEWLKECYLCFGVSKSENTYYSTVGMYLTNCIDASFSVLSRDCYNITDGINLNNCSYVNKCEDSSNLKYCFDCVGCHNCIFSYGLRNKDYCILNKKYSKRYYYSKIKELLSDNKKLIEIKNKYSKLLLKHPRISSKFVNCDNCSGDAILNSKNSYNCFDSIGLIDCKNVNNGGVSKSSADTFGLNEGTELAYEGINIGGYLCLFSIEISNSNSIYYSQNCYNSSNCFGCAGLRNKSYCILNKQYTKEQYEKLVPNIINKMITDGEWGEFFPSAISPFGYNETVAQEYFPLEKENTIKNLFNWSEYEAPFPKVAKMIPANKLPDNISDIPDDILNRAVECEITKKPFRIIKQELDFYRKHNLPIPRRHPDQRHLDRITLRNPRKIFDRKCEKCEKDIKTTYATDRSEIVYCEKCYKGLIY